MERAVPGKSVGKVTLGMSREEAVRLLGKPTRTFAVKRRNPKSLKVSPTDLHTDVWERSAPSGSKGGEATSLTLVHQSGKVIQINYSDPGYATPEGISPTTTFTTVRKVYPRMSVRELVFLGFEPQAAGAVAGFLVDDVKRGIAFIITTQDDAGAYDELPKMTPETICIHAPGKAALPVQEDELASPPDGKGSEYLPKIRDWFAGGPHHPPK